MLSLRIEIGLQGLIGHDGFFDMLLCNGLSCMRIEATSAPGPMHSLPGSISIKAMHAGFGATVNLKPLLHSMQEWMHVAERLFSGTWPADGLTAVHS